MQTYFLLLQLSTLLLSLEPQKEPSPILNWVDEQNRDRKEMLEDLDPNEVMGFEDVVMKRELGDLDGNVVRNLKANTVGDEEADVGDLEVYEVRNLEANKVAELEVHKEKKSVPSGARAEEHARILQEVIAFGLNQSQYLVEVREKALYEAGVTVRKAQPAHFVSEYNRQEERAKHLSKFAVATLHASSVLSQQFRLTREQVLYGLERVELRSTSIFDDCPIKSREGRQEEVCPPFTSLFRTADGSCNNPFNPRWGAAFMPFLRFLPPDYGDGIESFRRSRSNGPLPNPRLVSTTVHKNEGHDAAQFTMMVMQWGQFVDHDLTNTPTTRGFGDSTPSCCSTDGKPLDPALLHPDCRPIQIYNDDRFYTKYNVTCIDFIRSSPAPRQNCALGPRDQVNQITSYLDGSNLYGSSAGEQHRLRLLSKGKLRYTDLHIRKPLLPPLGHERAEEACRIRTPNLHCFKAGDSRVNEQPGLATLHTLWLREHNRVALQLAKLNPQWSDDRIFLESRRFIGAVMQHITYNEWLPIILGPRVLDIFELNLLPRGHYQGYNASVNPTIANVFGAAAFRFGHSLVKNSIDRCNKDFRKVPFHVDLHKEMNNPSNLHNFGSVDRILLGLVSQRVSQRDEFLTEELTNHLFQTPRSHYGLDLAALNLQRGRDHGIAPYNIWREQCGLKRFTLWTELTEAMNTKTAERLSRVYNHVDDIDLFTGGMAERPVVGGIVGPTFACIIGQQFLNLRKGDRFWYESGDHPGAFSPSQLQEIRKTSLARVICDCMDDVDQIQPFVFLQPDPKLNPRSSCTGSTIPQLDLTSWKEKPARPQQHSGQDLLLQNPALQELENEIEEEDDVLALRPPQPQMDKKISYNTELPSPLRPEQYYGLPWALEEERQKLAWGERLARSDRDLSTISFDDLLTN